ncbi:MAG: class I SAM-dependent methyltransferase [Marinobacterium sp.]|nr:class I SAM-dependent methyltransferase [Marinobacterium sp.]
MSSKVSSTDFFAHKAVDYEQDGKRVSNVDRIACSIQEAVSFRSDMKLMDFGAGTGLLLERIAPLVASMTAIDISASMIAQLETKRDRLSCELTTLQLDLTQRTLDQQFDGIISSMTLHHIENIPALFVQLHEMLLPGGFIALADLEPEDGSFHIEDTGVFHHGFEAAALIQTAASAGFQQARVVRTGEVEKPHGCYPVCLLVAFKAS